MKKIFFILICAMCAVTVNAQRYMSVTQTDGSITEYALSDIDSIHFFVKDNTPPEPPVVNPNPDEPFENGHEYVDLGLPSGTLWATCNVGATTPEGYGNYYAWGETTTKEKYFWETYQHGTEYNLTKYCTSASYGTVDNKTVLEAADDAATVNMGGNWRMPTIDELNELRESCEWKLHTQNNVAGWLGTSKKNSSKTIFFPLAGLYDEKARYQGKYGYYWTSSFWEEYYSYCFWLTESKEFYSGEKRTYGFPVRAVYKPTE